MPLLNERLSSLGRSFAQDQSIPIQFVLVHISERRRICVDADSRGERDISDVMRVIGTECAQLARRDYKGLLAGTMLLKNTCRYDEGSRRLTVVVEAG